MSEAPMKKTKAPAILAGLALAAPSLPAQDAPQFAAPVRLMAGEAFLGVDRLYPSPMFHDLDGDGLRDVVVGDLRGILTVARRLPGDGAPAFAAETTLKDRDGRDLDFENW